MKIPPRSFNIVLVEFISKLKPYDTITMNYSGTVNKIDSIELKDELGRSLDLLESWQYKNPVWNSGEWEKIVNGVKKVADSYQVILVLKDVKTNK